MDGAPVLTWITTSRSELHTVNTFYVIHHNTSFPHQPRLTHALYVSAVCILRFGRIVKFGIVRSFKQTDTSACPLTPLRHFKTSGQFDGMLSGTCLNKAVYRNFKRHHLYKSRVSLWGHLQTVYVRFECTVCITHAGYLLDRLRVGVIYEWYTLYKKYSLLCNNSEFFKW